MLTPHEHAELHALYPAQYQTLRALAAKIPLAHSALKRILDTPARQVRVHPWTELKIRKFLARERDRSAVAS